VLRVAGLLIIAMLFQTLACNAQVISAALMSDQDGAASHNCIHDYCTDNHHSDQTKYEQNIDDLTKQVTELLPACLERPERQEAAQHEQHRIRRQQFVANRLNVRLSRHHLEYANCRETYSDHCG
jgi:hypothetical protein